MAKLFNVTRQVTLAEEVLPAKSLFKRLRGLLGRRSLDVRSAMWIEPCNSIHTLGMQFDIDVIFVDRNLKVCKVKRGIAPGRLVLPVHRARSVFEFATQNLDVQEGDQLNVVP